MPLAYADGGGFHCLTVLLPSAPPLPFPVVLDGSPLSSLLNVPCSTEDVIWCLPGCGGPKQASGWCIVPVFGR